MSAPRRYLILLAAAALLVASCSNMKTAKMVPETQVNDLSPRYLAGEMSSKVDGWVLLLDASLSMGKTHEEYQKFDIARTFVERMNSTLPPVAAVSGLRTFGHAPQLSDKQTQLFYGMSRFDRNQMEKGISQVNIPGGPTPMSSAINAAAADLKSVQGPKAVIIVSDGEDLGNSPIEAAAKMVSELKGDVCVYTVLVGDDEDGKQVMEKIARTSECGYMVSALDVIPATPMANYVSDVFLSGKDTGLGYHKPEPLVRPLSNVHFKFDDHSLTQEGKSILDENIKVLAENPSIKLNIEGHTSAAGASGYNQKLSTQRAETVRNYIITNGNISSNRLSATGYGESRPKVKELNPEQKRSPAAKSNMRVELKVVE